MQRQQFSLQLLEAAGLVHTLEQGELQPFFLNRIVFPILDISGNVIGFSARKISEVMVGAKYINTPETTLFKKSKTLYGLNFSRRRIVKEKRAIIVEGQIDALRLIQEGFTLTIAGQGTAFTEDHVKELMRLGVNVVYLAFDGDEAGRTAAYNVGHLFQREGIEIYVVSIPMDKDPDMVLREEGPIFFMELLEKAPDYLNFLLSYLSKDHDTSSPAQKNHVIQMIIKKIRSWDHPLMVHESLCKLSRLTQLPAHLLGVGQKEMPSSIYIKKKGSLFEVDVDPNRVLETDLLRWLFLLGESMPTLVNVVKEHLQPLHFSIEVCRRLFSLYMTNFDKSKPTDLLTIANNLKSVEEQLVFAEIMQKRVNTERAKEGIIETIKKMLESYWMEEREKIKVQIQSGRYSEEEIISLVKRFDAINVTMSEIQIDELALKVEHD